MLEKRNYLLTFVNQIKNLCLPLLNFQSMDSGSSADSNDTGRGETRLPKYARKLVINGYTCDGCGKRFKTRQAIRDHQKMST